MNADAQLLGVVGLMRATWDLSGVADAEVAPHALRILSAARSGFSEESIATDLTDVFVLRLRRPIGNREVLPALARRIMAYAREGG